MTSLHTLRPLSFFAAALLLTTADVCLSQTFIGPVPYLSAADRPAGLLAGNQVLEDLEDASIDFGIEIDVGGHLGPSSGTDSVDADDGSIDGSGQGGHTQFGFGVATITFPAPVLEAGVVWTDGPVGTGVTFEAFGPGMTSLGQIGPFFHANNNFNGDTDEDRLYAVQDAGGIVAIRLSSLAANQSFELDHVQYATLGSNYCSAATNSTGRAGVQTVIGSPDVARNEVTLVASKLPRNAAGYFLASRTQGFVANAGGSAGNLCLGGSIGRFNGSIFNSGATGSGVLAIDLTAMPSPVGPVAVLPGESWSFQCWHRDFLGGAATSNFTDAAEVLFQ